MSFILIKYSYVQWVLYITYTSDGDLLKQRITNLGGGHRGYDEVDLPKQHHMVFGTRWEFASHTIITLRTHKLGLKRTQLMT